VNIYVRMIEVFGVLSILGFGGGKGIIPQMHTDVVTQYHWVTSAQFSQFYTIGKLVPGPTTIFAALIGFLLGQPITAAQACGAVLVIAGVACASGTFRFARPVSAVRVPV